MLFPVKQSDIDKCRFTSPYGPRWDSIHRGIDIAMPVGTELIALLEGRVAFCRTNSGGSTKGFGHYLVLYHSKEGLYTLYAHLKELPQLRIGDFIRAGAPIAVSGNTGNSTGPHLHFEIHEGAFLFTSQVKEGNDTAVDPLKYYPFLKGFAGRSLKGLKLPVLEEGLNMVNFENAWEEKLLLETIENLRGKGILNNADYWIKRVKTKKITVSELGLLALVAADRDKAEI